MKDEKGGPQSNVINLVRKLPKPAPLNSVMARQGLELLRLFLAIPSAEHRKQIVEFAKRIAAEG